MDNSLLRHKEDPHLRSRERTSSNAECCRLVLSKPIGRQRTGAAQDQIIRRHIRIIGIDRQRATRGNLCHRTLVPHRRQRVLFDVGHPQQGAVQRDLHERIRKAATNIPRISVGVVLGHHAIVGDNLIDPTERSTARTGNADVVARAIVRLRGARSRRAINRARGGCLAAIAYAVAAHRLGGRAIAWATRMRFAAVTCAVAAGRNRCRTITWAARVSFAAVTCAVATGWTGRGAIAWTTRVRFTAVACAVTTGRTGRGAIGWAARVGFAAVAGAVATRGAGPWAVRSTSGVRFAVFGGAHPVATHTFRAAARTTGRKGDC